MNPAEAQLAFAAEFVAFLTAAATLAIVLLRAGTGGGSRRAGRRAGITDPFVALVGAGLVGLGGAAFVAGARLVDDLDSVLVALPRAGGALLLALGGIGWRLGDDVRSKPGSPTAGEEDLAVELDLASDLPEPGDGDAGSGGRLEARIGAWTCAAFGLAAAIVAQVGPALAAEALAGVGGLALLVPVLRLARVSVAARIAASGAFTLLVLLLVLSVSLSAVLDGNLRDEALRRLEVRSAAESKAVNDTVASTLQSGLLVNGTLSAIVGVARLSDASSAGRLDASLSSQLDAVARIYQGQAFLFVSPSGAVVGQAVSTDLRLGAAGLNALTGSGVVTGTGCGGAKVSLELIVGRAYAVGVTAACSRDGATLAGRLVVVVPLDDGYLQARRGKDDTVALGLFRIDAGAVTGSAASGVPLAADGSGQPRPDLVGGVLQKAAAGVSSSGTLGDRFVAVAPVDLGGSQADALAVATSAPTSSIAATRDRLFGVLFAIALGGTLLALLFAALVGERIGSRLRRLTLAADAVARGEPGVQAEVGGGDEVGDLGATFDQMARSIDQKTSTELALRGRIEAVVAGMSESLVAVDVHGDVTDWNLAAEELVGVRAVKAVGRPAAQLLSLVGDDGADLAARLVRPPRNRWSATGTLRTADGVAVPVGVSGSEIRDAQGEPDGAVVVIRDLRGEREVEQMKTEFLSRVGHELRTPLTGVLGYAEMLQRREWPPERVKVMVGEIMTSGRRLERIVRMLEFFASDAAGRTQLRMARVDAKAVVDTVLDRWNPQISPPLSLGRRVKRGLPAFEGDAQWLAMAIGELVDNARKFSPAGGRIVIGAALDEDGRLELSVTDRGVGMTADQISEVFEAFAQGDASDTRRFDGLGLGLSLVRTIAEGHGGVVDVQSVPGRGSRVALVLPLVR